MIPEKEYLSVSELNDLIKDVLNMGFPNPIWVCGEIQGYNRNKDKKHVFFELCEKDAATKDILAKSNLVIFSNRKSYILDILNNGANAFELKDDIEVKFLCRVDFYPPHGAVRLIVESIDPTYTLGKIAQERQRLIAALKQKGILDKNKALPLPLVPLNVGLITSHDSAAYNDFISELVSSGYAFRVFCRNTLMQGKACERDVCQALMQLQQLKDLDVIVITRGGGSIADLSCFDSEAIAEAIAKSRLPVLSGIGHEINITITDIAAHAYQKTPTAIARFLVASIADFLVDFEDKGHRIMEHAQNIIRDERDNLKNRALVLQSSTRLFLKVHRQQLGAFLNDIKKKPVGYIKSSRLKTEERKNFLLDIVKKHMRTLKAKIKHYIQVVSIADPRLTLKRGFSITRNKEGELIRSLKNVKPKQLVQTQLIDGVFQSEILKIREGERRGQNEILKSSKKA